jgi:hypothetical protein
LAVEGDPHFTHLELALLCILKEMRSQNVRVLNNEYLDNVHLQVKIANLNFTKLGREVRDERDGSFPGKSLDQRAKYIKNILTK